MMTETHDVAIFGACFAGVLALHKMRGMGLIPITNNAIRLLRITTKVFLWPPEERCCGSTADQAN